MNVNGNVINESSEIHQLFGKEGGYINTVKGQKNAEYVTDVVNVNKNFSFLNEDDQPYIYDMSTGVTVKISKFGEDPHGIMIPSDFRYPKEKICIKNAYKKFNNWGTNKIVDTDWYKYPEEGLVF